VGFAIAGPPVLLFLWVYVMGFWEFEGKRPTVADGAFVHPEATIIGGVEIGEGCYVGAGAVLRGDWGDIVVGAGSNIQENCVLHVRPDEVTLLGPDCHIGHGAIIHGAQLGRHVMVGMHAVIHDGVVVGDDALVGSGCVVLADMDVPAGKMVVGVPGKIVGDVSADQKVAWEWGLRQYQALPARCLKGLRPL
jgi:phenylacetic acid degradation protein